MDRVFLHHINGDREDNRMANLRLWTARRSLSVHDLRRLWLKPEEVD
jgi:hypothetical protein